jgi:tetratricopeptide (TPR) repeat protein
MVNKFEHVIIALLLTFGMITSNVAAKTADSLQSSTKLQDHVIPRNSQYSEAIIQNDTFIEKGEDFRRAMQENTFAGKPKLAAKEMLETIDKIYVTLPPGSLTKEIQGQLWFLKGQSYTTLHQYEEAIKAFDESIKYEPNNLQSYSNISYILNQQAKYGESIKISDWIISKNALFTNAYLNKGYSLLGLLKYQEAIDNFEKARELDSDNMTVYLGYAKGYVGLKQHDKAIEIYNGIIKYFGKEGENSPQLKVLNQLRKEQINLKNKEGFSLTNNQKQKK